MRGRFLRFTLLGAFALGCVSLTTGCSSNEIELEKAPPVDIPPPSPPPKASTTEPGPRPGNSSGMNKNPGGNY